MAIDKQHNDHSDPAARATGGARHRRRQRLLGLIFIGAGVNHFVIPRAYRQIVPPKLGEWGERVGWGSATLVSVSGVAEVLGGIGVLLPATRRAAGVGLIALLAAVFPANLYMARSPERFQRIPRWALYGRLPLQPLMMWWVWRTTRAAREVGELR